MNTIHKCNTQIQNISFYFCTKYSQNAVEVLPILSTMAKFQCHLNHLANKEEHTPLT